MKIITKKEVLEILNMPYEDFTNAVMPIAKQIYKETCDNRLIVPTIIGYTNICKNQCMYCGMRAGNKIPRYRLSESEILDYADSSKKKGFHNVFLIAGEDPHFTFSRLLNITESIKKLGFNISLACGEYSKGQYIELKDAGVDEYVLKFEMSDRDDFNRLNPSTDFDKRMKGIYTIKECGLKLGSGNIVDYPGQTLKQLADDILLMKELNISWAPNLPYMPVPNTPLAKSGHIGDYKLMMKEISILRIMMPEIKITASQHGKDITKGLSDEEGNIEALNAGGNVLFYDILKDEKDFNVISNRHMPEMEHFTKMAKQSKMLLEI